MLDESLFRAKLKAARKKKGWSQETLANQINISKQSVSYYETSKLPSLDNLVLIAEKLDVSLDELCGIKRKEAEKPLRITSEREAIEALYALHMYLEGSTLSTDGLLLDDRTEHPESDILIGDHVEGHDDVKRFLYGYERLSPLLSNGTITEDVFKTWYSGVLQEADIELSF